MEDEMKDVKKIARQQYLKYFSVWFIGILVLAGYRQCDFPEKAKGWRREEK